MTGDCFALKEDGLYCNEHHHTKICDKLEGSDGGENNNNKNISSLNHHRELSEDGDDKSEEGKQAVTIISICHECHVLSDSEHESSSDVTLLQLFTPATVTIS